jgi:thiol-disulfide isomerase/thioredoxin
MFSEKSFSKTSKCSIVPGQPFPMIAISGDLSADDLSYLGITSDLQSVSKQKSIAIKNIDADLIIIEFLNTFCSSCRTQVPLMNQLYHDVSKDPKLKHRVKIIGIAAGNNKREVLRFKQERAVPFPIVPDMDFVAYESIGESAGTPLTMLVRKTGDKLTLLYCHAGLFNSFAHLHEKIEDSLSRSADDLIVRSTEWGNNYSIEAQRKIVLDLTRAEEKQVVKESMLKLGIPSGKKEIIKLDRIRLPNFVEIYRGVISNEGRETILFSKIISRKPVCDVCHGVHFIVTFDCGGSITDFSRICLTKTENEKWDERDVEFMRKKLLGKSVNKKLFFNAEVDAVSTATMTCALIFNSINRLAGVYNELKNDQKLFSTQ